LPERIERVAHFFAVVMHARQMCHGAKAKIVLYFGGQVESTLRADSGARDRDEVRPERAQLVNGFNELGVALFAFRRKKFKRQRGTRGFKRFINSRRRNGIHRLAV
jgi:hypothetical protein